MFRSTRSRAGLAALIGAAALVAATVLSVAEISPVPARTTGAVLAHGENTDADDPCKSGANDVGALSCSDKTDSGDRHRHRYRHRHRHGH
ncbi:hypothetical protein ACFVMC_08855 [Nocardia sp. NPDC127579]|uniref:hypothetical protein n=1 Tax=Nocardia sp. NPDC127579 TaxID=3345402 RepID=UPI00363DFE92